MEPYAAHVGMWRSRGCCVRSLSGAKRFGYARLQAEVCMRGGPSYRGRPIRGMRSRAPVLASRLNGRRCAPSLFLSLRSAACPRRPNPRLRDIRAASFAVRAASALSLRKAHLIHWYPPPVAGRSTGPMASSTR